MRRAVLSFLLSVVVLSAADMRNGAYRGRPVVFENNEGLAVYQGDIILGNTADIESPVQSSKPAVQRGSTTVVQPWLLWPNGVIPYAFDASISASKKQMILEAVDHWNTRTPIHLQERTTEQNYVRFSTGTSTVACSSPVGMVGGPQTIRLPDGCSVGNAIHEIGHSVGLWHEQSRLDRNRYISVLYENIDKSYASQFDQELGDSIDAGPYDFNSIMHYGAWDFSVDGVSPAMETVPAGIPVGQLDALSAGDIQAVQRLYGHPPDRIVVSTTPSGLKLRVDGALVDDGTTLDWAAGTQHTIEAPFQGDKIERNAFGSWSDGGAESHTVIVSPGTTIYTANFITQYWVQPLIVPDGGGEVRIEPASPDGFYTLRSNIYITARPAPGYKFVRWTVLPSRSLSPRWTTVQAPTLILTTFDTAELTTITSNPIGRYVLVDGSLISTPVNFAWPAGETHTLDISSSQSDFVNYTFTGWDDGGPQRRNITATGQPATHTANFAARYKVTTAINPQHFGSVFRSPDSADGYYDQGTNLQLTPNASHGFTFTGWSGDLRGSANPATLNVDETKNVLANFTQTSLLPVFVVASAATGDSTLAPGQIISIYGSKIGPSSPAGLEVANGRVTSQLAGVEVLFDGEAAPLAYVSENQINAVVPYSTRGKASANVQIRLNGQTSAPIPVSIAAAAPGLFTVDSSGRNSAAILNQNGSYNSAGNPANRGDIIVLYATGEGATNPQVADGQVAASVYPKPVLPVSVRIAGIPAVVHYAGAAPGFIAGLMQINVQIPEGVIPGPKVPISLVVGDEASPFGVTVAIN